MLEIPGVRHTYSATERGRAMVTVRFRVGEEMGASIVMIIRALRPFSNRFGSGDVSLY